MYIELMMCECFPPSSRCCCSPPWLFSALLVCTSSLPAALLNSRHQAAASLRVRREMGNVKSIALHPAWYSPASSALQRLSSYRGEFALVIGAGDFSDSMKKDLDTAVASGNVYRQKN